MSLLEGVPRRETKFIELKLKCVPGQLSLDVTNISGTAKDLGSNLSRTYFFSNGKYSVSSKTFKQLFVTSWNLLFAARIFFIIAFVFNLLIRFFNVTYLDIVFPSLFCFFFLR